MTKQCLYCEHDFEPKSPTAKFCSNLHRNYYFRKHNPGYRNKKTMAGIDQSTEQQQQNIFPPVPLDKIQKISQQLDPASQLVFDFLREQNAELRADLKSKTKEFADEMKALNEKIATLAREKAEIEKSRDDLQRNLDAKPTGLAGLVTNQPDLMKEALPILSGLAEKLLNPIMNPQASLPPFVQWLYQQPQKFQEDFMGMVSAVMKDQGRMEVIQRSLMSASMPNDEVSASSRYS